MHFSQTTGMKLKMFPKPKQVNKYVNEATCVAVHWIFYFGLKEAEWAWQVKKRLYGLCPNLFSINNCDKTNLKYICC